MFRLQNKNYFFYRNARTYTSRTSWHPNVVRFVRTLTYVDPVELWYLKMQDLTVILQYVYFSNVLINRWLSAYNNNRHRSPFHYLRNMYIASKDYFKSIYFDSIWINYCLSFISVVDNAIYSHNEPINGEEFKLWGGEGERERDEKLEGEGYKKTTEKEKETQTYECVNCEEDEKCGHLWKGRNNLDA